MGKKRVSELITIDKIKTWGIGDTITIKAGTGAGKSYFIKNILYAFAKKNNKRILFLIHRTNCVNQFQKEIEREKKTDVITIMTYQKLESKKLNHKVSFDFSDYEYIVCDEFHYFMSDSAFSKTCDASLNQILEQIFTTKIFMSATGEYMKRYINNIKKIDTIDYELDITYDFIKELKFFNSDESMESYIEEAIERNEKTMFFIQSATKAYELYKKYEKHCLFNCGKSDKHYKYVDTEKIDKMLIDEKFQETILITTTCMDAGVNINDEEVKHIICDVKDIGTLIQCIGRKRQQNDNDKICLYIKTITNEQLGGMKGQLKLKMSKADFLSEHTVKEYIEEYPRSNDYNNIVYHDTVEEDDKGTYKINELMYFKCLNDICDIDLMINEKCGYGKYGYCKFLATKFGFRDEEGYYNYDIEEENNNTLEKYLESIVGKKLFKEEQKELIDKIDLRQNGKQLKSAESFNASFKEQRIPYIIDIPPRKSYRDENGKVKKEKTHWTVYKIVSGI